MIPGHGGTQRLARLVGIARAKKLIYTGALVTAYDGYMMGLVDEVVPKDKLDDVVAAFCKLLASMSPLATTMAKEAINKGMQTDIKTAMAIETRSFLRCFASEDRVEGMRAFLEKREPKFIGR